MIRLARRRPWYEFADLYARGGGVPEKRAGTRKASRMFNTGSNTVDNNIYYSLTFCVMELGYCSLWPTPNRCHNSVYYNDGF